MSKIVGDEPAFPIINSMAGYYGLSKREWLACTILAGMLSGEPGPHLGIENSAKEACQRADALLVALNQESSNG